MLVARVQEFATFFSFNFAYPISFADAQLEAMAKGICSAPIGEYVSASDIVIKRENPLFSYSLFIPLFNRGASVVATAQKLTIEFRQGRTKTHLKLMADVALQAITLAKPQHGATANSLWNLSAHATFDQEVAYVDYMARFVDVNLGITSGGVIWLSDLGQAQGSLRYTTEKSLSYANALFISAHASFPKIPSKEAYELMGKRFDSLVRKDNIDFRIDD